MRLYQYLILLFIVFSFVSCAKKPTTPKEDDTFKELLAKDLNGTVWDFYAARSWSKENGIIELKASEAFIQSIEFVDKWIKVVNKIKTEHLAYNVSTNTDSYVLEIFSDYESFTAQLRSDYTEVYLSIKPSKDSETIQTIHFKKLH